MESGKRKVILNRRHVLKTASKNFIFVILVLFQFYCASGNKIDKMSKYKEATVIESSGLIMRSIPSKSGEKLCVIPCDAKVYVEDENGPAEIIYDIHSKWMKVHYNDKTGWVFGGFLNILDKDEVGPVYKIYKSIGNFNRIYGLIDKSGKVLVEPRFIDDLFFSFNEGLAPCREYKGNDKYGYINKKGQFAINPQFDYVFNFSEGVAKVRNGKNFGFIDKKGTVVKKPENIIVVSEGFKEGMAGVNINGKYGFINRWGKVVIKPEFDSVQDFSEGLAVVSINGKSGFINKAGETVIKTDYDSAKNFNDGLAMVQINDKWGYIDKSGKIVINPIFSRADHFYKGIAFVIESKLGGFIDKTGQYICKSGMDYIISKSVYGYAKKGRPHFVDGRECIKVKNKYGYIDRTGKMVIKPQFDNAGDFSEGLAMVSISDRWGYIDNNGDIVIKPQYIYPGIFIDGLAMVGLDTGIKRGPKEGKIFQRAYIDKKGKILWKGEIVREP
jgi:hypothetical protein